MQPLAGDPPLWPLFIRENMGNPPSVTYPSPNEFLETVYPITAITNDNSATITCSSYPFSSSDPGLTSVTFKQVSGMLPINGQTTLIQTVSGNNFTVNINTTNYPAYVSGGVICIDTGQPPTQTQGFQTFNTPWQNIL